MIARGLLHEPRVIFLDEPTVGLDPQARLALWEVLRILNAQGRTIVMTTHQLAQAKRHADSVVFLCAGCVTECTEAAEFFSSPRPADGTAFLPAERP